MSEVTETTQRNEPLIYSVTCTWSTNMHMGPYEHVNNQNISRALAKSFSRQEEKILFT